MGLLVVRPVPQGHQAKFCGLARAVLARIDEARDSALAAIEALGPAASGALLCVWGCHGGSAICVVLKPDLIYIKDFSLN